MLLSVIMTSYNGSAYILRQLESLAYQYKKPDEVLIFDDCSTDNTVEIITQFIENNKLSHWRVICNKENLGWKKNFAQAINAAKGDIVFLSDQDDEWKPNKIENIYKAFLSTPSMELVISNYEVEYVGEGNVSVRGSTKTIGKKYIEKLELKGNTYDVIRPGCTMAFRREITTLFNKIWSEDTAHDRALWDICLARGTVYIINESLIKQIRHPGTNTPISPKVKSERLNMIRHRRDVAEAVVENVPDISDDNREWLHNYINVANYRVRAINEKSIIMFIRLLFDLKYYPKLLSWFADISCSLKG